MRSLGVVGGIAVLNLIITGIPSILTMGAHDYFGNGRSFKPYYNWNTFNTTKLIF